MTRQKLTIGFVAAAFAVSVAPTWAQTKEQAGSRPNTGQTTGSAEPRGGGGGGGNAGGGATGGSSSTSGSSGGSASSGFGSSGSTSGYAPVRERAPERPNAGVERRAGGGDRAVMRGGSGASGNTRSNGGTGTTSSIYGDDRASERSRAPVPAYSRPREGRPVTGGVAERPAYVPGGGGYYPIYDPYYYYGYYDPYWYGYSYRYSSYWMPGYGYGFGYFGYDPFLFGGYYDPYAYSYGQASSGGYGAARYGGAGALRLKVRPTNAQVYIDGYYVGVVDSFDGMFQRLDLEAGSHRVEVRAEGYETATFDLMLTPGETVTYKGELKRIH